MTAARHEEAERLARLFPVTPAPLPPLPRVIGTVDALRNLPDRTIIRTSAGSAAQIRRTDDDGHYLLYVGTDLFDSLDPEDLKWDRQSFDSLTRSLPAVILDEPK